MKNQARANNITCAGFTLIELLIGSGIISVVILSMYSAFSTGIMSYRKFDASSAVFLKARMALNRMETDLKNSFIYSDIDSGFKGGAGSLEFRTVIDAYQGNEAFRDAALVKYELSGESLTRACGANKDELAADTKKIRYAFAVGDTNPDNPDSYKWQDTWPEDTSAQGQNKELPLAVKITLTVLEKGQRGQVSEVKFEKIVSLPLGE